MPRQKLYVDISVVEAAKKRLRHVYNRFDTVIVSFSGGKDSLACVHLAREICEEMDCLPVKVMFIDEEIVSPLVVETLERVAGYDWVDMEWYCLSLFRPIYVMGHVYAYITWDEVREKKGQLFRDLPPWGITNEHYGLSREVAVPAHMNEFIMQDKRGSIGVVLGVRADESMFRYRVVTQKLSENYINQPKYGSHKIPMKNVKPLYDWTKHDVFKYLIEVCGEKPSEIYDERRLAKVTERVGGVLAPTAITDLKGVMLTEPEFYQSIIDVWPQVDISRRYWNTFDRFEWSESYVVPDDSPEKWNMARKYIEDTIHHPRYVKMAKEYVARFRELHRARPEVYPFYALIHSIGLGEYISYFPMPIRPTDKAVKRKVKELKAIREKRNAEQ